MTDKIHIVLASNHRYLPGLKATAASMLMASADKTRLVFHVIADGLPGEDRQGISDFCRRFGYVGEVDFRSQDMTYFTDNLKSFHGSHTTYCRLHFPSVFPNLNGCFGRMSTSSGSATRRSSGRNETYRFRFFGLRIFVKANLVFGNMFQDL